MLFLSDINDLFTRMILSLEFGDTDPVIDKRLFGNNPAIKKTNAKRIPVSSKTLILDNHTGSWCICNKRETDIFDLFQGKRLDKILSENSSLSRKDIEDFIIKLYCRGLLLINNRPFYNPEVFKNEYIHSGKALFIIIPTTRCNLSCRYCSAGNHRSEEHTLKLNTAQKIVDLMLKFQSEKITVLFHGGEPLLELDLIDSIINYTKKQNQSINKILKFRLQTNAALLSEEFARRLRSQDVNIGVSFDGDKDINDRTRIKKNGCSSFYDAYNGLLNARKENMEFGSICVLSRLNYQAIPEIMDFYSKNKLSSIKINPVSPLGKAVAGWEDMGITSDNYFEAHNNYLTYLEEEKNAPREENIIHMINNISSKMSTYMCMRSQCGAGKDFFTFTPSGDIFPCDRYRHNNEFILGNVFSVSGLSGLRENNRKITEIFTRNINNIDECKNCDFKMFCRGGCSLETYNYFGEVNRENPWCDYYKKMYMRLFGLIIDRPDIIDYLCNNIKIFKKDYFDE